MKKNILILMAVCFMSVWGLMACASQSDEERISYAQVKEIKKTIDKLKSKK